MDFRYPAGGTGDDGCPVILTRDALAQLAARLPGREVTVEGSSKTARVTAARVDDDSRALVVTTEWPGAPAGLQDVTGPMSFGFWPEVEW